MQLKGIASATFRKKCRSAILLPIRDFHLLSTRDLSRSTPLHLPWWELSIDIFDDYALPLSRQQTERFSPFFCFPFIYFLFMFWIIFHYISPLSYFASRALARRATKSLISIITIRHKWYDNLKRRRVAEWAFLSDLVLLLPLISQNNILFTRRHWIALHSFRLFFHFVCYVIVPLVT